MLIAAALLISLAAPESPAPLREESVPLIAEVSVADVIAVLPSISGPQAQQSEPERNQAEPQQDQKSEREKPPTPPHTGIRALLDGLKEDVKSLPSKPNLYLTLMGGGLALSAHPFDQTFNVRLRSHYDLVNNAFKPAKYYGNMPEQVGLALGTYAFGRIFQQPKVSHLGMDLLRAQALSELLVQPIKLATHRTRPDGSNNYSFPSGHSAATFAAATVIERHLGWKRAALAYAIAAYVAASRLHDNRHYLSDVLMGAAIGSVAGRTVTEHGREAWTLFPAAVPGGVAVVLARNPQQHAPPLIIERRQAED